MEKWAHRCPGGEFSALERHLDEACRRTGLIRPEAARWIAPVLVLSGPGPNAWRQVMVAGEPFSPHHQDGRPSPPVLLGTVFWSMLTDVGRVDPSTAARMTVNLALRLWRSEKELRRLTGGRPANRARIHIACASPQTACRAVLAIRNQTFSLANVPLLPLPGCAEPECCGTYAVAYDHR